MVEICKVLLAPALWVALLLLVASAATRGDALVPQADATASSRPAQSQAHGQLRCAANPTFCWGIDAADRQRGWLPSRNLGSFGPSGSLGTSPLERRRSICAGRLDPVVSIDLRVVDGARHPI